MKPIRVLASDDERIVIDSYAWIISHFFKDRIEFFSARNGLEAIRMAAEIKPDIYLMDIMMPGLNGIETIRALREREPQAIFIVVSAYDDFSYARDAVSLGVFEYILKPVDRNRLVSVLEAALVRIRERATLNERQGALLERLDRLEPALEQAFVHAVVDYRSDPGNLSYLLPLFLPSGGSGRFLGLRFVANAGGTAAKPASEHMARIRTILRNGLDCVQGSWLVDRLPLFCRDADPTRLRETLKRVAEAAGCPCRVGMGCVASDPEDIHRSYQESLLVLNADEAPGVFDYADLPAALPTSQPLRTAGTQEFIGLVRLGRVAEAVAAFERLAAELERHFGSQEIVARRQLMELIILAKNQDSRQPDESATADANIILECFDTSVPFSSWLDHCRDFIGILCQRQSARPEQGSQVVQRAKAYIEVNYTREIGIEDIAAEAGVSPGHLSHLFRQETGTTMIDFLTDRRLTQAKVLLRDHHKSVKEVAGQVGYRDPNYFSRVFRQRCGMTVSDYRQSVVEW